MPVLRFLPASIRRAFSLMAWRVRGLLADTPFVFFGVVIAVALLFRVGAGWVRESKEPVVVAPTFETHAPSASTSGAGATLVATPSATTTSTATVGAAGKVEPIGAPARVAPRPRGHGRRAPAIH